MKPNPSPYTAAGSSHQKANGEAAWRPPTTTPHSTGARSREEILLGALSTGFTCVCGGQIMLWQRGELHVSMLLEPPALRQAGPARRRQGDRAGMVAAGGPR